ncbi:hypothetical protein RJ640_015366 [Escallonia rubra]|uniref:Uncharacterized protein n=1 Tax=Escallonia rubra TaxID=112253 RepID=A0AA88QCD5_9ASTE|nr:hypothetical protein RJ640_015366 [Escallonia rubra]
MGARLEELVKAHGRMLDGRGGAVQDGRGGVVLSGCKGQPAATLRQIKGPVHENNEDGKANNEEGLTLLILDDDRLNHSDYGEDEGVNLYDDNNKLEANFKFEGNAKASDLEAGLGEDIDSESWSTGWLSWLCGTTGTTFTTQPYHPIMKHSATELASAGVNFKPRQAEDLDVEFNTSCWFHWFCGPWTSDIPPCCIYNRSRSSFCFLSWFFLLFGKTRFAVTQLCIEDSTESFLRNLIAFEQCIPGIQTYFTSYAFLMYTLIDDEDDVELLEKAGVLRENLGTRQNTLKLFKNLCKEVVLADFSFFAQWKEVHNYCNSYSHKNLARVRRNCAALRSYYFSNRWAFISGIAAFTLFTLQVVKIRLQQKEGLSPEH